ncbi:MAG: hypothetical protein IIA45_13580 [Bacteroidetes bacterium]|nr:hypothetical protein [Bacteroidota bacterium]
MLKYNTYSLNKIEAILTENNYVVRYGKGNFKTGYCILHEKNIIVINKFFSDEGKVNSLIEVLQHISIDAGLLTESSRSFYDKYLKNLATVEAVPSE